jgi:hypothetical protein
MCGAVTASYPGRVSFHSSADLHKNPFVSSEFSRLLPILEADFCLALGRKKYVKGFHTILKIVEGGALVRQYVWGRVTPTMHDGAYTETISREWPGPVTRRYSAITALAWPSSTAGSFFVQTH